MPPHGTQDQSSLLALLRTQELWALPSALTSFCKLWDSRPDSLLDGPDKLPGNYGNYYTNCAVVWGYLRRPPPGPCLN